MQPELVAVVSCLPIRPGTLDRAVAAIHRIQNDARITGFTSRPRWPVIVLRSPKGWTGPKVIDGSKIEGTFRAHQVPILVDAAHPGHVADLEAWMRSYREEELFDGRGRLIPELAELAPEGDRRMGANPHTMAATSSATSACRISGTMR